MTNINSLNLIIRNSFKFVITLGLLLAIKQNLNASQNLKAEAFGDKFNTSVRAFLTEYKDGTKAVRIDYQSKIDTICYSGGSVLPIDLFIVFVTEINGQPQYHTYKMYPFCPRSNTAASFEFDSKNGLSIPGWMGASDPHIWERLFPKNENGDRWFALRVGFFRSHMGSGIRYDNLAGQDYRLIFK